MTPASTTVGRLPDNSASASAPGAGGRPPRNPPSARPPPRGGAPRRWRRAGARGQQGQARTHGGLQPRQGFSPDLVARFEPVVQARAARLGQPEDGGNIAG